MLLERLDLDRHGLEKVRSARGDPDRAAAELLAYFRARTSVRHPVDRAGPEAARKQPLAKATREVADDALRNVLVTCPHYPRHDFGKDIDWLTNKAPNGDREWVWQLNRHDSWGALGAAWWATGDGRYAECYVRQLLDWTAKCPPEKDSPAWRTIEAGIRGLAWTGHFQHFVDAPAYAPEALVRHLNSFHDHAAWLTGREMSKSNWGLMEAEGAAFIAMTFPEFKEAPAWRGKAFSHLDAMMKKQVRVDGHQYEQCLGYHLGCISWFARTAEMATANDLAGEFPPEYWRGLERMCAVPMALGFPDGTNAQFGDDHSQFGWRGTLAKWGRFFKREDLLYAGTAGREGKAPAATAFALTESGFYSMRSGWDEKAVMLVLKCGPDGGWHCQPDNGTFEIFAGGRRLTPDSGTYIYSGDEQVVKDRAWFRQTRVHPTLTLDGRDTAFAPKLLRWKPGADLDALVVGNAGYPGLTHRRAVLFVKKSFFVIVDEALGDEAGNAWLHFQLAPAPEEAAVDAEKLSARTGFPDGTNLLIQAMAQDGLKLVKKDGQVSFHYGKKEPRPAFRFEMKKDAKPVRFVTVLVPHQGSAPTVGVALVGAPEPGAAALELDVTVNGAKTRVGYELKPEGKKE